MIDEKATLELFGYVSSELKPKSNKKIVCVCNKCGKSRNLPKSNYKDLCINCSRADMGGENNGMYGRTGINYPNYKPKIIKICEICGNEFKVTLAFKNQRFCSRECQGKWQSINRINKNSSAWKGGKVISVCKQCNKEFKIIKQRKNTAKFCSKKCHNKWMSINQIGEDNPFYNHEHTDETKNKISGCNKGKLLGENNPMWQGGISYLPYCEKFTLKLKQLIRDRYDNCDYISGIHKDICNKGINLDVHHVDYNKQQGCDSDWKLIPLSKSNHVRTNSNRPFWNKLFKYSLEIDKIYY
jgi:hypothetical protein